jgi:hypothetical protein
MKPKQPPGPPMTLGNMRESLRAAVDRVLPQRRLPARGADHPPYRQGSFGERFYTDARRSASASFLINPPSQHDSKQGACTMKTKIIIAAILITLGADAAYAQRIARVTSDWESRSRTRLRCARLT